VYSILGQGTFFRFAATERGSQPISLSMGVGGVLHVECTDQIGGGGYWALVFR
jgi:hypothetical protein